MFSSPNPTKTYLELKNAIAQNKRPVLFLHAFLSSGSTEANIIYSEIAKNKTTLKLITSPEGRKWIKFWLDDILNFLQKIAEQP